MNDREDYLKYVVKQINTAPFIANNFLNRNGDKLNFREAHKDLKRHVDDFLEGHDENRFIIMPGLRGIGKSTLLLQIYEYLRQKGIEQDRILYLSIDQLNLLVGGNMMDAVSVFIEDVHKRYPSTLDKELFVLIDEAQEDANWSQAGKVFYDQSKKIFMLFTGSKALDFELDANAARRTTQKTIYPMNFKEYLLLKYDISSNGISDDLINAILTGDISSASDKEMELLSRTSAIGKPLIKEWEYFLCYGGLPLGINLDEVNTLMKIYQIVERIIDKDVRHYKSFNGNTRQIILNILSFLSTQKPGGLSVNNLSKEIGISRTVIIDLLDILEKTHMIFHIGPYGGASKTARNPLKYYFLTPCLAASINFTLGKHNPDSREYLGILAENYVASSLFRLKNTIYKPNGIFYPVEKGMADLIITTPKGDKIPIEVGIGKKGKRQIKRTMNKYNCDYGIIISSTTELIKRKDNIIYLPLTTFSFV